MPFCFYEETFYCEITNGAIRIFSIKDTDLGSDNPKTGLIILYRTVNDTVNEFSYVVAVFARFTVERFLKKETRMSSAFSV